MVGGADSRRSRVDSSCCSNLLHPWHTGTRTETHMKTTFVESSPAYKPHVFDSCHVKDSSIQFGICGVWCLRRSKPSGGKDYYAFSCLLYIRAKTTCYSIARHYGQQMLFSSHLPSLRFIEIIAFRKYQRGCLKIISVRYLVS